MEVKHLRERFSVSIFFLSLAWFLSIAARWFACLWEIQIHLLKNCLNVLQRRSIDSIQFFHLTTNEVVITCVDFNTGKLLRTVRKINCKYLSTRMVDHTAHTQHQHPHTSISVHYIWAAIRISRNFEQIELRGCSIRQEKSFNKISSIIFLSFPISDDVDTKGEGARKWEKRKKK